jgi:feruloyl-CoA synthase
MLLVEILAAAAPVLQFALVTGHDRAYVGILGWPNIAGCKKLCENLDENILPGELLTRPEVESHLRMALTQFNAEQQGSSSRIGRIMLMSEPPDSDANEITDKGYINQRAALQRRQALVEQLYAEQPGRGVLVL